MNVTDFFAEDGPLSKVLPGYRPRAEKRRREVRHPRRAPRRGEERILRPVERDG